MPPIKAEKVIEGLYPSVIGEVIGASLADFEDTGVSLSVLDELKSLWEKNLTDLKVGKFPWDPVPVPIKLEPEPENSPPFNFANFQKHRSAMLAQPPITLQHHNVTRSETSQDQGRLHNPEIALQRAQEYVIKQQLQQARPVITAVAAQTVLGRIKAASSLPPPKTYQQQTVENPLGNQSSRFRRPEKDGIGKYPTSTTHPYAGYHPSISYPYPPIQGSRKKFSLNPPQFDGPSDSSLSDTPPPSIVLSPPVESAVAGEGGGVDAESPNVTDDSLSADENEDFEEITELLVCLYDKVWKTRHKAMHKWKCTLRDGVLAVGEKEYVFWRAHAELTW